MKIKFLAAALAAFLIVPAFSTVAYAGGGEEIPQEITEPPAPEPTAAPNPFTPDGTGTVLDNATDEDGKEFFTIMTPNENVFYLVIDRQRTDNNVYFLNAVTEQDLMALAEIPDNGGTSAVPEPMPEPTPQPEAEPEPEQGGGPGMVVFAVVVILLAGGAAYYFKIYRPKRQGADSGDEYEGEDSAPWPDDEDAPAWDDGEMEPWAEDDADDGPPWDTSEDEAHEDYEREDGDE